MWMRAVRVWALITVVMVANGMVRAFVLDPLFGAMAAQWLASATGIVLILLISQRFLRSLNFATVPECLGLSALWVALTVTFEFGFGHYAAGESWSALVANYDLLHGRPWPLVLLAIAAAPFIARPHRPARLEMRPAPL